MRRSAALGGPRWGLEEWSCESQDRWALVTRGANSAIMLAWSFAATGAAACLVEGVACAIGKYGQWAASTVGPMGVSGLETRLHR